MRLASACKHWFVECLKRIVVVDRVSGKRHRQQLFQSCSFVLPAIKSQSPAHYQQTSSTSGNKCFDVAHLISTEETSLNTTTVSYTHLRAHETPEHLVCR